MPEHDQPRPRCHHRFAFAAQAAFLQFALLAGLCGPTALAAVPDSEHQYGPHWRHTLDFYRPDGAGPFPVVIYIHGGGWLAGDKSDAEQYADDLLARGIAVVGINHRYSQNATFPAQLHDCKGAVRWLRAHAASLNISPERIAAFGESSGGHLASLLGMTGNSTSLEGTVGGNLGLSSEIVAFVDAYGPSDFFALAADGNSMQTESQLIGYSVPTIYQNMNNPSWAGWVALVRSASPAWHSSPDDPPSMILHGTDDPIVPYAQSEILYNSLVDEGAPTLLRSMEGVEHEITPQELQALYGFLEEHLDPDSPDPPSSPALLQTFLGVAAGDSFGRSTAFVGDVNGDGFDDLLVGAPNHDLPPPRGPSTGRAWVLSGRDGSVIRTFSGRTRNDLFGYTVAAAGDVNGDGRPDLLIGAPGFNGRGIDSGRVYLFSGQSGSVLRVFDGLATGDRLGKSLAGAGDVDGDGTPDVVAGAPDADPRGSASGMAIVFSGSTGGRLLRINGARAGDRMGWSVAGQGDTNGDGRADVIVGSPYFDSSGSAINAGRVVVYGKSGSSWVRRFVTNGQAAGETFGLAVAMVGDVNGDGRADFAAGAPGSDVGAVNNGRVRVYSGATRALLDTVTPPSNQSSQRFGVAIAGVGDVSGDGRADFAVGCGRFVSSGANVGRVVVYRNAGTSVFKTRLGESAGGSFGVAVSGGGDADNDGGADLIVGGPTTTIGGVARGACWVYSIDDLQ